MTPTSSTNLRQITELESILKQMTIDHLKLLQHVQDQHAAMRNLKLKEMDEATNLQEACRLRIAALEQKRRTLVSQIARSLRLPGEPKIPQLAELFPQRKEALLKLRTELRDAIAQVATKNHVVGKLAGAVLGHLNTALRLLAGAVEHAGLYTKQGLPRLTARIGVMEAVG